MRLWIRSAASVGALGVSLSLPAAARAQAAAPDTPPAIRTYKAVDGVELKAHVFGPPTRDPRRGRRSSSSMAAAGTPDRRSGRMTGPGATLPRA